MQHINGIPFVWDTEADNALLGGMFPQGVGQAQTNFQNLSRTPILDYEWQFLKRSVEETHDALFMIATPEPIGNVTLQQEPGTQVDFSREEFIIYRERGNNKRYNQGVDEILFTVSVIVLKDGGLVERLWKETEVRPNQVIFFIENNENDWSSAKMYASFGEDVRKKLLVLNDGDNKLIQFFTTLPEMDKETILELINYDKVEKKVGAAKKVITGIMKFMSYFAGGPGKIVGGWCETAGEYIMENFMIPDSVWDSHSEAYSNRKKLEEKLLINNDFSTPLASFRESVLLMPTGRYVAPILLAQLKNGTEKFMSEFVLQYNNMVRNAIETMLSDGDHDGKFGTEYTAYLCGICNGATDFVGGTLAFVGQLLQFNFDFAQDVDAYLERFDSFIAKIKPFFARIWIAVSMAYDNLKEYLEKFDVDDVNWDKVAYFSGYAGAFIASFFIPFTALAKPAATASKLKNAVVPAEMLADISSKTAKVSKFVMDGSRKAAGQMLEFLDDILKLMSLGLEELTAFLDDILKKMADWLMKNKKVVSYVDELSDVIKAYTKVLNFNPGYKKCLLYIQQNGRVLGEWITIEHEAMIRLYSGGTYRMLNKALREMKLKMNIKAMQKVLDDALEKLPASEHNKNVLLRSAEFSETQIRKLFRPGSTFKDRGFFSTTYSEEALLHWMKANIGDNVLFKVYGKNGKLIEKASLLPHEQEVLFKSGTEFVVESVREIPKPTNHLELITEIILKEK